MDLNPFFNPDSIAVVGASHEPQKVGHLVAKNLIAQGYKGEIYLVNNKQTEILGRKTYPDLKNIRKPIDLAVFAVPNQVVMQYLDEIIDLKIKNLIIYSAGFKEIGKDGVKNEEQLEETAQKYNINILGPNCIGYINTSKNINLTFMRDPANTGNIGLISQSGALGSLINDYFCAHRSLGFSHFISLGNKTVIDESDALEFLLNDNKTDVIGLYLEDINNGEKFKKTLEKVTRVKPIIILKGGETQEGAKAALSHTGAMISNQVILNAIFEKYGAVKADNLTEFLNILKIFSFKKVAENKPVLILSNAGGIGVLVVDKLIKNKLTLLTISEKIKKEISAGAQIPEKITLHNPIDLLGDASAFDFEKVINATIKEQEVGSIIILLTPQANTEIEKTAGIIAEFEKKINKPVYPVFLGEKSVRQTHLFFEQEKIASFETYDSLAESLAKIRIYMQYLAQSSQQSKTFQPSRLSNLLLLANEKEITKIIQVHSWGELVAAPPDITSLNVARSLKILELIDVKIVASSLINNQKEAIAFANKVKYPVVAKTISSKIIHKTEKGGVIVNINNETELINAYKKLTGDGTKGCLIQKMLKGHEVIVGAKRDSQYGIILTFGIGGIYTELFKEITTLIYPIEKQEFVKAFANSKVKKLFDGFRGSQPVDSHKLFDTLQKVGLLMKRFNTIKEIDINPLILSEGSLKAVDCRLILS